MSDCQLYLVLPTEMPSLAAVQAVLAREPVAAALLPAELVLRQREALRPLVELLQEAGVAVLAEGMDAWRALPHLDGVQVEGEARHVAAARKLVGQNGSVGALCGLSRHAALEAGEAGADYAMFTPDAEPQEDEMDFAAILAWWSSMMELPCVGGGLRDEGEIAIARASGAEFYAPRAALLFG